MPLATSCKLCEYYLPSGRRKNQGLCNRIDDPCFVYSVKANMGECLYENSGQEVSEEEHRNRLVQAQEKTRSFEKTLKNASRIVASWPEWKRAGCR